MKTLPGEIERESFSIIREELRAKGVVPAVENEAVILRCIHASADFDYADTLRFTPDAVRQGVAAIRSGTPIVTDTNMAKAGVSRAGLRKFGGEVFCFMAEPFIAEQARAEGSTRASAAMNHAAGVVPQAIFAVGNAPTALFALEEQLRKGLRPSLIIAAPVGFVNVVESKERILRACLQYDIPAIVAMGRKGGSSIAAAICNALIYTAADMLDPAERGWN